MAGPIFPACGYIKNPVLTEIDSTSLDVAWSGVATTFKLRYRKTGTSAWTEVTMAGPGSSGGSTYFTSNPDNAAQVNPVSYDDTVTALFHLTGLEAGAKYDLELVNICLDGSEYTLPLFFAFTPACAAITGFKILSEIDGVVKVVWDAIVGVTTYVLVVDSGEDDDDEYEVTGEEFELRDLIAGEKYVLTLNYLCGTGGEVMSEPLAVIACACVDKEPIV